MPTDYMLTRSFSDTAFVEDMLEQEREREHMMKALAPKPRKVVGYKGTAPQFEDEPTVFGTLFGAFK